MGKKRNPAKANKLIKTLIKNDISQADTARELGVTQPAIADQIKNNPIVRQGLQAYLEKLEKEIADDKSIRVISEAMDAMTHKGVGHGDDFEVIEEVDHYARLKANDQYLKIRRLLTDDKTKPQEQHLHLHFGNKKDEQLANDIISQISSLRRPKSGSAERDSI